MKASLIGLSDLIDSLTNSNYNVLMITDFTCNIIGVSRSSSLAPVVASMLLLRLSWNFES